MGDSTSNTALLFHNWMSERVEVLPNGDLIHIPVINDLHSVYGVTRQLLGIPKVKQTVVIIND